LQNRQPRHTTLLWQKPEMDIERRAVVRSHPWSGHESSNFALVTGGSTNKSPSLRHFKPIKRKFLYTL